MSVSAGPARWRESFLKGTHQHFCAQGKFQQIPAPPALARKVVHVSPPPVTQVLFQLLALPWNSERVCFCARPLRAKSGFLTALQLSWICAQLVFKARCYGAKRWEREGQEVLLMGQSGEVTFELLHY